MMVAGFVIGARGHGMKARWVVAVGIIMIFLATLLLPLAVHVFEDGPTRRRARSRALDGR